MHPLRPILILVLLVLASAGCYTLLSHPQDVDYVEYDRAGLDYARDCRDCHEDSYFYHASSRFYGQHWSRRYYDPWWYENYWFYDPYYYPGVGWDGDWEGDAPPGGSWSGSRRQKRGGDNELIRQVPGSAPPPATATPQTPSQVQGSGDAGSENDADKKKDDSRRKNRRRKR